MNMAYALMLKLCNCALTQYWIIIGVIAAVILAIIIGVAVSMSKKKV